MEKKPLQPAISVDEQIENLKSLGLEFNDEDYAKKFLENVSYFRLIKAYSLGLKNKNSNYDNITFEQLVELYMFNSNFRQLLFTQIERVEINLRCRISNYFSLKYGVLGYENPDNFIDENYHKEFLDYIKDEIIRNRKTPFIRNFQNNYIDGKIPFYALIEIFSFGALSKFYKNMKKEDKKYIAQKYYNVGYKYLESWFEHIAFVRNICAHYGRLYNAKLTKTPKLYKEYSYIDNSRVYATLLCLKEIVLSGEHWINFVDKVSVLLEKYPYVDKKLMGFPDDWDIILKESNKHEKQLLTIN